jgi:hypothetical protein
MYILAGEKRDFMTIRGGEGEGVMFKDMSRMSSECHLLYTSMSHVKNVQAFVVRQERRVENRGGWGGKRGGERSSVAKSRIRARG